MQWPPCAGFHALKRREQRHQSVHRQKLRDAVLQTAYVASPAQCRRRLASQPSCQGHLVLSRSHARERASSLVLHETHDCLLRPLPRRDRMQRQSGRHVLGSRRLQRCRHRQIGSGRLLRAASPRASYQSPNARPFPNRERDGRTMALEADEFARPPHSQHQGVTVTTVRTPLQLTAFKLRHATLLVMHYHY